jgi:pilus assembly protein CpaE
MSNPAHAYDSTADLMALIEDDAPFATTARPLPRVSIAAFCDDQATAQAIQTAADDRRMAKTHVTVHMGGAAGAAEYFRTSPTPNLIIIDSMQDRSTLLSDLDHLAEFCDAGTKVLVIGHLNDVSLYRELLKRGVSEYQVAPITPISLMESISTLYTDPASGPLGQVWTFIGAKGGVGASTICHNVAWSAAEVLTSSIVIGDFDLPFGTTGLDFNQDPEQGIADALASPDRLDQVLLDRLLTKCNDRLSLFTAPATLSREYDLSPDACDHLMDVVRNSVPYFAVDLPHVWTSWARRVVMNSEEIVLVAEPDLANLRNAKNLVELLKKSRSNDNPPRLVVNMVGKPKRQEIPVADFCTSLGLKPTAVIEFDAENFSRAAINGHMLEEENKKAKVAAQFRDMALVLANKPRMMVPETKGSSLTPILQKLGLKA